MINLVGAGSSVPGFVYGIFVSLFVLFMSFALNQWLQYREIGPWTSYAFGEKTYLVLSLVAKSALAWQIFSGSLAASSAQRCSAKNPSSSAVDSSASTPATTSGRWLSRRSRTTSHRLPTAPALGS